MDLRGATAQSILVLFIEERHRRASAQAICYEPKIKSTSPHRETDERWEILLDLTKGVLGTAIDVLEIQMLGWKSHEIRQHTPPSDWHDDEEGEFIQVAVAHSVEEAGKKLRLQPGQAMKMLKAAIETVKRNLERYHVPG